MIKDLTVGRRGFLIGATALGTSMATSMAVGSARAQSFPSREIEFIVPYSAGGSSDLTARLLSAPLAEELGKAVLVVNMPGASSIVGTHKVATSAPDGHTLLGCAPALTILASKPDLPYSVLDDLAPITRTASAPYCLVVNSEALPVTDMEGVIRMVKDAPDKYLYAHGGVGTSTHLAMEYLKSLTGMSITGVPYPGGGGPGALATSVGDTHLNFASPAAVASGIADGSLTLIGYGNARRWSFNPEVPTIAEQGVEGFEVGWWSAVLTTGGTPPEVVEALNAAVKTALESDIVTERFNELAYEIEYTSADEFADWMRRDVEKWRTVIETANIPVE